MWIFWRSRFHKLLAPFGVGVLYAKQHLLEGMLPFLYGGDMIAEGRVLPDLVEYNALPWKYAAGTPNILGAIVSGQAVRMLLDLALSPRRPLYFGTGKPIERAAVQEAMGRVAAWNRQLTARALDGLAAIPGITIYGPRDPARRTSLVAFNLAGRDPVSVAQALDRAGIEARAGCHCATLAHHSAQTRPARQLPAQLLPLQHPRRDRPGRRRGGRHRHRPPRTHGPVVPAPPLAGPRAGHGGTGMTVLDAGSSTAEGSFRGVVDRDVGGGQARPGCGRLAGAVRAKRGKAPPLSWSRSRCPAAKRYAMGLITTVAPA